MNTYAGKQNVTIG